MTQDVNTLLLLTDAGSGIGVPYVNGEKKPNPAASAPSTTAAMVNRVRVERRARAATKSKREPVARAEKRCAGR